MQAPSTRINFVAVVSAFVGLLAVVLSSRALLGDEGPYVAAYMGAATVLVFAVPESPLARPWPLVGGHLVSALVGVTCAQTIPDPALAAASAVALAILAMQLLRCVHPPGGAAAMVAVIGGSDIRELGYLFVLWPVGLNVAVMLIVSQLYARVASRPDG